MKFFIIIMTIIYCYGVYAQGYQTSLTAKGWPGDASTYVDNGLELYGTEYGLKLETNYFAGTKHGLIFGGGIGQDNHEYLYNSKDNKYSSKYTYGFLQAGYWMTITQNDKIAVFANGGIGTFSFEGSNMASIKEDGVLSLEANAQYQRGLAEIGNKNIILLGGLGISRVFVPDFAYDNKSFTKNDFNARGFVFIGLGYNF